MSSNILNYQPYVPYGHFSYSWVMITNSASNIYAQIGNYEYGGGREVHVQYNDGGGAHDASWGAMPLGQYTNYKITYSGGLFYFYANSYVFSHYASWIPTAGEFASEITSLNVQMMGATYSGVWFASNQLLYNGSWHYLAGNLRGNSADFGISGDSSSFVTWDRACSY